MQNEHKKDARTKRSESFTLYGLNKMFLCIYSFFARCRLVKNTTSSDKYYDDDVLADMFKFGKNASKRTSLTSAGLLLEKGRSLNALGAIRAGLASLAANIYGIFAIFAL